MTEETIVAVYDTAREADAAIHDLKAAGVPPQSITLHAKSDVTGLETPGVTPPPPQHFIPRMFGYEPTPADEHDTLVYQRSLQEGASVVAIEGMVPGGIDVAGILEKHHPVDIDERGSSYGVRPTGAAVLGSGRVRRYSVKATLGE